MKVSASICIYKHIIVDVPDDIPMEELSDYVYENYDYEDEGEDEILSICDCDTGKLLWEAH